MAHTCREQWGGQGPGETSWLSLTSCVTSKSRFLAMLASVSPLRTVYGRTCANLPVSTVNFTSLRTNRGGGAFSL